MTVDLWRQILRQNFTRWDKLADFLELDAQQRSCIDEHPHFSLNLPMRLAAKITKKTLDDPILKQFLPTKAEKTSSLGFVPDPVSDATFRRESRLLHKYEGRALLICSGACAMHCRYCFRQNFDYGQSDKVFQAELEVIRKDPSIREIILSGGDPLSLSNERLEDLVKSLSAIPHIGRIRFHTRFPMGIPERIDASFLQILEKTAKQIWFVIHANHPREFDPDIFERLTAIRRLGCPVLNQAVLLRGVNDDAETLKQLSEILVDQGIMPYYLHQLDRVQGAAHFDVPESEGKRLIEDIAKQLPGYAVPKYVREIAGESSKTSLS